MFDSTEIILVVVSFATATLSAILGMGGGILLLAVMLGFMPHAAAIPLHAGVQISSNTTRTLAYLRDMDRRALGLFAVGVVPGAVIGAIVLLLVGRLESSEPYLKCLVGAYVLCAPFIPRRGTASTASRSRRDFIGLGLLAGTAGLTIGAVGPLIAPIFARHDYVKERLIATKAACQILTHLLKLPVFIALGRFHLTTQGPVLIAMMIAVIPATLLGKKLLRYVSPAWFRTMYRVVLVAAGAKVLIADGLMPLLPAR